MENLKSVAIDVYHKAKQDDIGERAAGLAYYMIFALIPLLLLLLSIFSIFFPQDLIQTWIAQYFQGKIGVGGSLFFTNLLDDLSSFKVNTIASIIGIVIVAYAGTNLFIHLHRTFSAIFELRLPEGNFLHKTVRERTYALSYIVALIILIFVLIVGNISSSLFFGEIQFISGALIPGFIFAIGKSVITFIISVFVFEMLYHFASEYNLSWRSAFFGALVAAFLFAVINAILSIYLSLSNGLSAYGTIGFFIAFLLWFYYTSFALFLGAEVSQQFRKFQKEPRWQAIIHRLFRRKSV